LVKTEFKITSPIKFIEMKNNVKNGKPSSFLILRFLVKTEFKITSPIKFIEVKNNVKNGKLSGFQENRSGFLQNRYVWHENRSPPPEVPNTQIDFLAVLAAAALLPCHARWDLSSFHRVPAFRALPPKKRIRALTTEAGRRRPGPQAGRW
jgi:hypothetical protein